MSTGLLDFFVLEGSECVEQLDGLLARAPFGAPDLDAFARNARALRGSATMAKVGGISDIAGALERVVKGLRDGSLQWTQQLRGTIIGAVDDLKILVRLVRSWGPKEDSRASACLRELNELAPPPARSQARTPIAASGGASFLAVQTADVAIGLQRFADTPGSVAAFAETLARIRALRGVAALLDLPPLAEVVAAVDDAAKGLEIGSTSATEALRELFATAAAVLQESSTAIRAGGRPDASSPSVFAFTVAAQSFVEGARDDETIVPIKTLFPDDGGNHVLHAEPNPPTTPSERFKFEVVSHAEHLRRLVADARRATDAPTRQRLGHELRTAIRALERSADSFGETIVASSLKALTEGASALDSMALTGLDQAAALLASRADAPLAPKIAEIVARNTPPTSHAPIAPPPTFKPQTRTSAPVRTSDSVRASTPVRTSTPVRQAAPVRASTPVRTPTPAAGTPVRPWTPIGGTPLTLPPLAEAPSGPALSNMLNAGIMGLSRLGDTPFAPPTVVDDDDDVVPIQDLLYRGRAALQRASQLGHSFRSSGATPNADELAELFDLLELADAD